MADVTASSAAETLVGQLKVIGGGKPCVVVAHSMGGAVATAAGFARGRTGGHRRAACRHWRRGPSRGDPRGLYGDVDEATATAAIALLVSDAPLGVPAEAFAVARGRYGAIPHTHVTCTKDNTIPIALQRRFVTEIAAVAQTPTAVIELDSSHSPFLSQPAALAAAITEACPSPVR